jgi:hypothetical protein
MGRTRSGRLVAQAVFSGHRLAREIDSPNPDVPLPFIRERRLVGATEADYTLGAATSSVESPPLKWLCREPISTRSPHDDDPREPAGHTLLTPTQD